MVDKKKILDAWIMVEHLSEGDINLKNKEVLRFDELKNDDFHSLFINKIKSKNISTYKNSGIVLYFDIFDFQETIDFLRNKYGLERSDEDIQYGNKFSFALYFDKNLNFDNEETFFTESGYIRHYQEIPVLDVFRKFEDDFKDELKQYFEIDSGDSDQFNSSLKKVFNRYSIKYENCRFQILINLETEANNLHSFFVDDLAKAKNFDTDNLSSYLFGGDLSKRVNLDSKNDSQNFNPECFKKILHPKNYPLGRFPSNITHPLYFMQQVAVNLSVSYDDKSIRSVNGPPGTGKTTLIRDIFAELIVSQSYDIFTMKNRKMKGSNKTKYYDKAKIGILPSNITEKSIVVASSNNGALQNIVNELPLIKKIDKKLVKELLAADYFKDISNNVFWAKWEEDENGKKNNELVKEKRSESDDFWGLISLEGGKSENITKILNYLKAVEKYLNEEYEPNDRVYQSFQEKYEKVQYLRNKASEIVEIENSYNRIYEKLKEFNFDFDAEHKIKEENRKNNEEIGRAHV